MICKKCNTENAGWRAYCSKCGHPLGTICRCSFPNQTGDLYCGGCGQPLSQPSKTKTDKHRPDSCMYQMSEEELKILINESLLIKFGDGEQIKQDDIDSFFND